VIASAKVDLFIFGLLRCCEKVTNQFSVETFIHILTQKSNSFFKKNTR